MGISGWVFLIQATPKWWYSVVVSDGFQEWVHRLGLCRVQARFPPYQTVEFSGGGQLVQHD